MAAPARRVKRLSGLQKQVLSFYRQCLRATRQQPTPETRQAAQVYVRAEFRKKVGGSGVCRTYYICVCVCVCVCVCPHVCVAARVWPHACECACVFVAVLQYARAAVCMRVCVGV